MRINRFTARITDRSRLADQAGRVEQLSMGRAVIFGLASMLDFTGALWFRRPASTAELDMALAWRDVFGLRPPLSIEDGEQVAAEIHPLKSDTPNDASPPAEIPKRPRSHWDMLMERRTVEDLEQALAERLETVKERRKEGRQEEDRRNTA